MRLLVALVLVVIVGGAALRPAAAQAVSEPQRTFDVASIKPNNLPTQAGSFQWRADGVTIFNYSLNRLLQVAYGVHDFQIVGGPDWLDRDRFDVTAKASGPVSRETITQMLQTLLRERFQLVVMRDVRSGPVLNLVVAHPNRLGPQLSRSAIDCRVSPAECKMSYTFDSMRIQGQPLAMLAEFLTSALERSVVDRTDLSGPFNFFLQYNRGDKPDSPHPSLVRAIEEQLGLKLEAGTGPVKSIVVERAGALIPD